MAAGNMHFAGSAERERSTGAMGGSPRPTPSHQPPQGQRAAKPRAESDETLVVVQTTNFSFAPGPVWLEAVNTVAIDVAAVNPVTIDVPLRGGGQMLMGGLDDVLVLAILAPQGPPFDQEQRFGDEAHPPFPPGVPWWPIYAHQPISSVSPTSLDPNLPMQQVEKLQEELKKKQEEEQKKAAQAIQKAKDQEKQEQQQQPKAGQPRVVVPIPGTIDEWLQRTGMSAQGFPGFPRHLDRTMAKGTATSGLPTTAGISYIDCWQTSDSDMDWDIDVYFAGTGTIPIGQRWLFMTLRGV